MEKKKCLYCYKEIHGNEEESRMEFHASCCKKFFGKPAPPLMEYSQDDMFQLAEKVIKSQKTVTGVQPKLSLSSEKISGNPVVERLTIVGLWGEYILKPQTEFYAQLPENEDLSMHLASLSGIKTVDHSLIRLKSGELAYLTKRIDRVNSGKIHMEDMCQITERLTEHKYRGSHEQIARAIRQYADNPGLDVINFYEVVVFSFLSGNNDMHLKNFSLLKSGRLKYHLAPAYDLVASELVVEGDDEELALTLNAKKKKIKRKDFVEAMKRGGINDKSMENIFNRFKKSQRSWHTMIDKSFLNKAFKEKYHTMIDQKLAQLEII